MGIKGRTAAPVGENAAMVGPPPSGHPVGSTSPTVACVANLAQCGDDWRNWCVPDRGAAIGVRKCMPHPRTRPAQRPRDISSMFT